MDVRDFSFLPMLKKKKADDVKQLIKYFAGLAANE